MKTRIRAFFTLRTYARARVEEFFDTYNLTSIRACLREWLSNVVRTDEIPTLDYIHLHDKIERLIEAAWLLHQLKK